MQTSTLALTLCCVKMIKLNKDVHQFDIEQIFLCLMKKTNKQKQTNLQPS